MDWEKFQKIRESMKEKALALMKHEGKDSATVGVLSENITEYNINGRVFYSVKSNVFKHLTEKFYMEAHQKFPSQFGTGNANDVIDALYKAQPVFDIPRYIEFLKTEQFAYLFELTHGTVSDKVLRLDLFRKLDTNTNGYPEFTGGLMHALKHFSVNGINLSTGTDVHNITNPEDVVDLIVRAFFITEGEFETSKKLVSILAHDEKYNLRFVFYLEENTNVYFVQTIFKEKQKSSKGAS